MNWNKITIHQYQQVHELLQLKPTNPDEQLEQQILIAAAILNKSKEQIETMGRAEWKKVKGSFDFLQTPIPTAPLPKWITIGFRRYRMLTTVNRATVGQLLIDLRMAKTEQQMINNLHKLVAAFVIHPWYKRVWWKLTDGQPDNERIASDLQKHCPFVVAYSIALFFCEVWTELSTNTLTSLIEESLNQISQSLNRTGTLTATDGYQPLTQ